MQMLTCDGCGGLTPRLDARVCIHCEAKLGRRRNWLAFVVGTAGTVLLAACYGPSGRYRAGPTTPTAADRDGDGWPANMDCDDQDPTRFPGAADPDGDGIDQNCDGVDGWRDEKSKIAAPPDAGPAGPDA
jgi:hypothetical protein